VLALLLLVAVACGGGDDRVFAQELKRKEAGQIGPKYVLGAGKLPDGFDWMFTAYRRAKGQICMGLSWAEKHANKYQGACTPDDEPRPAIYNSVVFITRDEEVQYMFGIAKRDGSPVKVRGILNDATQDIPLIDNRNFPDDLFYVAKRELPTVPDTIQLLDASNKVIVSLPFRG
jgi:hypothetical protein